MALLLQNSTITEKDYHRQYVKLLDNISTVKPQPALGTETIPNTIVGKASQFTFPIPIHGRPHLLLRGL